MITKNQGLQFPAELQQQISVLNTRIGNTNLAYSDMLKEINNTFNKMSTTIVTLRKENAELQSKLNESTKK